jgi:putative transport protein
MPTTINWLFYDRSQAAIPLLLIVAIAGSINHLLPKSVRSFGAATNLLVGIAFGLLGITFPLIFATLGLYFFLYIIGLQSGKVFGKALKEHGLGICIPSLFFLVMAMMITLVFRWFLADRSHSASVGMFAGTLMSTPGLASVESSLDKVDRAYAAFSLSYPIAMLTLVVLVRLVIRRHGDQLMHDAKTIENAFSMKIERAYVRIQTFTRSSRFIHYYVIPTRHIRDGHAPSLCRGEGDLPFVAGDYVRVVGGRQQIEMAISGGRGIIDPEYQEPGGKINHYDMVVCSEEITGRSIGDIASSCEHAPILITRVFRDETELLPVIGPRIQDQPYPFYVAEGLELGDIIRIVGEEANCSSFIAKYGRNERSLYEGRLYGVVVAIVFGLIAMLALESGVTRKMPVGAGLACGPLLAGLLASRLTKWRGLSFRLTGSVKVFLRELGLNIFMASVGVKAGSQILQTAEALSPGTFVWQGIVIGLSTVIAIVGSFWCVYLGCIYWAQTPYKRLTALCSICSALTSSLCVDILKEHCRSPVPHMLYAMAYPIVMLSIILLCLFFAWLPF